MHWRNEAGLLTGRDDDMAMAVTENLSDGGEGRGCGRWIDVRCRRSSERYGELMDGDEFELEKDEEWMQSSVEGRRLAGSSRTGLSSIVQV